MGKYSDIIAKTQTDLDRQRARSAGLTAPAVEPDAMGRAMSVADARGLPPSVVADNLGQYDQEAQLEALDSAAGTAPALAHWLGNPDHAALSKDDTGTLGAIGSMFTAGVMATAKVAPWMPIIGPAVWREQEQAREAQRGQGPQMSAVEPTWFSELIGKFESGWHSGQAGNLISLDRFNPVQMDDATARGLGYGSAADANAGMLGTAVGQAQRRSQGADRESAATTAGFEEIAAAEATGSTWNITKAVATNPRSVMAVVAQSLGSTAPQLALSAAMPASRIVAATTAGGGSFTIEQGMTVLDVMGDAGVETSDPAQVTAFLRDQPAMEKARQKALTRGIAVGAFDALTAGFAGRLLANSRRSIASIGGRVVGEGAIQGAGGAAGEAAAQLGSEGRISSQSDILLEAAAEVPTFLAEGRGQIAEARRAALNNADRFDAAGEQSALTRLVDLAAASKTRGRSASRFESLIQDMTREGEDTVYLSADGARKLFQSAADGGADLSTLVDPAAMREAMATGGELAIPLARYATMLSPEQHASIADQVRLQPGGRHDLPAVSPEEVQEAITAGLAEARSNDERENGPAGQVFDDVYGQLLSRQGEKLARQSASVVQSVYRNLAERNGVDAWTLYEQFRINIPGARTDGRGRPKGVDIDVDPLLDALRSGQLPSDQEIYGDTLTTALHRAGGLKESGGELANMDAAKARPGLVNNLAGMSLDDALMWAHTEGFIAESPTQLRESFEGDAPDINTLLDMLGQDLAGAPQYRVNALNPERAKFRADAQSLRAELEQRGIDVSTMDNAQVREAMGRTLEQPAFHGTPHEVDRFSLQKIGSGEGNQAYGWGLYFASNKDVAEWYRTNLSSARDDLVQADDLGEALFDVLAKDGSATVAGKRYTRDEFLQAWLNEDLDVSNFDTETLRKAERAFQGHLYHVEVPDDPDVLDYDKPLADQPASVRLAIEGSPLLAQTFDGTSMVPNAQGELEETGTTAGQAYQRLAERLGQQGASEAYLAAGIPGLRYTSGSGNSNYVIWDENAISEPTKLFQLEQTGERTPRGSVTFGKDSKGRVFNIELLAGMDASTFMHEMGHVYLEVINDLAAREDAPQQVVADMAKLNAWLGREDGAAITTEQHEQFARGFEAYLREGNSPSSALRRVFAAFKVWLTAIYRSARQLNVELTDDVRAVMDRIVASDAEIADARGEQYHEALITDAVAVGMSLEDFAAYQQAVTTARADAEAVVTAEALSALQREQKTWYLQEKRKVRDEVLAELRQMPVYRAQRLLRTGKLPNGELAPDELAVKLDKEDLLDRFGQSFLRNLSGMYRVEGGVRADEAASLLGFGSGATMIDALVNAPPINEAAAAETDSRMAARHPDPMTDGTLPDRAMVAAHRDRQADVMVREIRVLEALTGGQARAQGAVVKGIARTIIGEKKLRHLQPATYKSAEARAGREAFEAAAKQDWPAALAARRRQLLNFELFREAVRARNEAAAAAKYLAKFSQDKTRARLGKLGGDYLDQVDNLLDRFDFRKISDTASDRRASLRDWVKAQEARGVELNLPEKLLDDTFRTPYREMTVSDLGALRDAIRSIDHLARLKGKLLLAGELRDAVEIDEAMAASLREAHAARPVSTGDRSNSDKIRQAFQQGRVLQGTATDIARELDGFKAGGAIWANTVGIIRDAVNNRVNPKLQEAQNQLAEIYTRHYTKAEIRMFNKKAPMAEVNGDLWSKGRLLSLALNWGNEGNREAILTQARGRLSGEQAAALLGRLDARDWAFVAEVWGLIDSQWPAIAEAQKRRTGLVPERVVPTPFAVHTSDGKTLQIPGGYYPLKYESDSVKTMKDEADDFYNSIRTGRSAKASTRNGHTIERVGSGGRSVRLDTGVVQQHLRDVIRDVYLGDAINYVHNTLNGPAFREALDATGTQEYRQALEVWLKDAAAGEIGPRVWHERAMRAARQNFTASVLTFKFVSAALQVTGIFQSSVVLGHANTWSAVQQYLRRPLASTRYVRASSPYMDSRMRTHIEAVQTVMDAESGRFEAGKAATIRWGYWMMGRVQSMVDTATWMAAENQGMRLFSGDVDKARLYADDAVSRAQGSGEFMDKSPLQRGTLGDNVRQTEWVKATTALMGYMIAKGNAAYEVSRRTNFRSPRQVMKWAADMTMLYAVEGLIVAAIRGKLPDDEDDDGIVDDIGEFVMKDSVGTFLGTIPGAATIVDEFRGYDAGGVLANAWRSYAKAVEQAKQGELDRAAVKSAVTAAGITLGLPSSQINKTIDAISARADGQDVSPYEYLSGPNKE